MYFIIGNIGCSGKRTFEIPSAVCAQFKIQCPISQRDRFDSINFIPGLCLAFSNSLLDSMPLVVTKLARYLGPPPQIFAGKTATVVAHHRHAVAAVAIYFAKSSPGLFGLTSHSGPYVSNHKLIFDLHFFSKVQQSKASCILKVN